MTALIVAVFLASVMGSLHCAGMCGAFAAFAVGPETSRPRTALHAAYNLGRLTTYIILGSAAGAVGAAIDLGGSAAGLQRAAAIMAGSAMIVIGLAALLRRAGLRAAPLPAPTWLQNIVMKGQTIAMNRGPVVRAAGTGLVTTLLPCGWLYAFLVTAAGTGGPLTGALTMFVFWLGTLPIMVAIGAGVTALAGPLRRFAPTVATLAIVAVGVWTVLGRLDVMAHGPLAQQAAIAKVEEPREDGARAQEAHANHPAVPEPGAAACCELSDAR